MKLTNKKYIGIFYNFIFILMLVLCLYFVIDPVSFKMAFNKTVRILQWRHAKENLKYILLWSNEMHFLFKHIGVGQSGFIKRKCPYTNCYVTRNRSFFKDLTKFDVIAFNAKSLLTIDYLPTVRSEHQKYVFTSIESAFNYPICNRYFDEYFNWTWTYKLDSDAKFNYIIVKDASGNVVGPNKEMHWASNLSSKTISEELRKKLRSKTKLAAWFVSHCSTPNKREEYIMAVQKILWEYYGKNIDIYGRCGKNKCPKDDMNNCLKLIERDYFFYFAFENSFSEDYVTEKLLHALNNYAVPIVYGGANYTRFMPKDIYVDARQFPPASLATYLTQLIEEPDEYEQFFKWHNEYTFHSGLEQIDNDYCNFCKMLNNETLVKTKSVYETFFDWWEPNGASGKCSSYDRQLLWRFKNRNNMRPSEYKQARRYFNLFRPHFNIGT